MSKELAIDTSIAGPSDAAIRSSGAELDSSSDTTFVVPAAKKVKRQAFRQAWLKDPQFQFWLQETEDPYQVKCTVCSKFVKAAKGSLQHHANTTTHSANMQRKPGASISVPSDATTTRPGASVAGPSDAAIRSSDTETDSNSDTTFVVPAAKKVFRQTFREAWLKDPQFQSWLEPVKDNPYKGRCRACSKFVAAIRTDLNNHANSRAHCMNMIHQKEALAGTVERTFAGQVKSAEMRVCMDALEHNRSFQFYCHFIEMLQKALPEPDILSHMSLNKKKMTAIVKNVINKSIIAETTDRLQGKFFSVLIDETTDITNMKILCFLIRYVHNDQIQSYLLDLIRISDSTADNLYKCLLHSLNKNNLSLSNMVGVCVDNANGMVGAQNSLASRLLEDNPDMCVFPCICHSMHLVASHACKCLPPFIEEFLHAIYSYFARNPKRLSHLKEVQQFMNVEQLKVLQPSGTRWMAVSDCVKGVLNQWGPLYSAMATAASEKESDLAVKIYDFMNCRFTKAYLEFLSYALDAIININKLFQTSNVVIHCLLSECYTLLRLLAGNFIKAEYIGRSDIHKIDVEKEENLLALETIYPGSNCVNTLSEIENSSGEGDHEKITEFYRNVKKFYQSAFQNIVKRMPFDEIFLDSLDFLNPAIALDINRHRKGHLACILKKFKSKNFNEAAVIDEWRSVACFSSDEDKEKLRALGVAQFWHHISSLQNVLDGSYKFKNISKLAQLCLSLPHSNADVERYFSLVTKIKTKDRNRLQPDTIAALTRIKLYLKNKNANCFKYEMTDRMLNLFNANMYNIDAIPKKLNGILLPDEPDESEISENPDSTQASK
ncbi:zinc finger protein 862-like [Andrena cerasifolii]|uniref:zinc finger protein 862-like n=1 Tax=Andrena cerasifolii TaxID=2819439 RepID=UPI0040384277